MDRIRPLLALFFRSLREDTRARLPTILRFVLVIVILLIIWENQRDFINHSAPGREFYTYVMLLNLGVIAVAALSIFPSAITEEKEDETLTLLRMTNLNPAAILFGKSTSRFVGAILLLAVQVPFTMLAITLGGISMEQVWKAYVILAVTTFFLCNLALLASVICRTSIRAGFLTGAVSVLLYVGIPITHAVSGYRFSRLGFSGSSAADEPGLWEEFLIGGVEMNPVWALMSLLQGKGNVMADAVLKNAQINLVVGSVLFFISLLLFDRYCARLVDVAPKPKRKPKEGKRHRWGWVTRTWPVVPLAWKDFHFMVGGRLGFYIRLGCAFALLIGIPLLSDHRRYSFVDAEEAGMVLIVIAGWCAALEILLIAGRIFGVERRRQTLSSLVSLPWSTGKIIRQKVLGCLPALIPWVFLAVAGVALSWGIVEREFTRDFERAWNSRYLFEFLAISAYVFLQALLLILMVAWLSLRMRRGALPAGIVICGVWNIVFAVCVDVVARRDEGLAIAVGALVSLPMLVLVCRGIYTAIPAAAAEES